MAKTEPELDLALVFSINAKIGHYMLDNDLESALFWAEKLYLYTRSQFHCYQYMQVLLGAKFYSRVVSFMERWYADLCSLDCFSVRFHGDYLVHAPLWARYVVAKALSSMNKLKQALELLHDVVYCKIEPDYQFVSNIFSANNKFASCMSFESPNDSYFHLDPDMITAQAAKLKGTLCEQLSDGLAVYYYITCLKFDISCAYAGRKLFENKMINPNEMYPLYFALQGECARKSLQQNNTEESVTLHYLSLVYYMIASDCIEISLFNNVDWIQMFTDIDISGNSAHLQHSFVGVSDEPGVKIKNFCEHLQMHNSQLDSGFLHAFDFGCRNNIVFNSYDVKRYVIKKLMTQTEISLCLQLSESVCIETDHDEHSVTLIYALMLFQTLNFARLKILADTLSESSHLSTLRLISYKFCRCLDQISIGDPKLAQETLRNIARLSLETNTKQSSCQSIEPALIYMILGHAAWMAGDREHALAAFNTAVDLAPGYYIAWFYIGELHCETSEYSIAFNYLLKAHQIAKKQLKVVPIFIINEISTVLAKKNRPEKAVAVIRGYLKNACRFLNINAFEEGDVASVFEASQYSDKSNIFNYVAKMHQPRMLAVLLHNLAFCYYKLKNFDSAYHVIKLSLMVNNSSIKALKLAGIVSAYRGDLTQAQFYFHQALLESSKVNEVTSIQNYYSRIVNDAGMTSNKEAHENQFFQFDKVSLPPKVYSAAQQQNHDVFCLSMISKAIELIRGNNGLGCGRGKG